MGMGQLRGIARVLYSVISLSEGGDIKGGKTHTITTETKFSLLQGHQF